MRCEILLATDMAERGRTMLRAMIKAAPIECKVRQTYGGKCELLMTYGTGHPIRRPWWLQHRKNGGHCIGWDLGYWKHRENETFRMRCTIDTDHPPQWLRDEPSSRFDAESIPLRSEYDPLGPIVLIGLGPKSARVVKEKHQQWELSALARIRAAYPQAEIIFRPKRPDHPLIDGIRAHSDGPIEDAIRGASLIVCRHSNVAIDACIAGIPVVCEDGIASALYGADLINPKRPTESERLRFLRNVAWWQWKPEEAAKAWKYLLNRLSA